MAPSLGLLLNFFQLVTSWFPAGFFIVLSSLFFVLCSLFFVHCSLFFVLLVSCLSSFFGGESLGFEPRTSEIWSQHAATELWSLLYIEGSKFPYISFIHNNDIMLVPCLITAGLLLVF